MKPAFLIHLGVFLFLWLSAPVFSQEQLPSRGEPDFVGAKEEESGGNKPTREIVYKKIRNRELRMFVFEPEGFRSSDRRGCFVSIHGGGWGEGKPEFMFRYAAYFAKKGMVGISLEYRKWNPKSGISVFDCVKDGRSAIRYLRAHVDELGIDSEKIVVSGASTGGHIAAGTALFEHVDEEGEDLRLSPVPNALVLLFPVIDTSKEGYGHAKIGERWQELSPLLRIRPGLPPVLMFHSTGDKVCPFAGSKAFHESLLAAGNRCELVVQEGGAHSTYMRDPELYLASLEKIEAFLKAANLWPDTSSDSL